MDELAATLERLARVLQNETHTAGLKPVQWEALRYLARANRFSRNPSALTAYLGLTKGTVSQTLMALERKGCIVKTVDPNDRRNVGLDLTKDGVALLTNDPVTDVLTSTSVLKKGEQKLVAHALQTILGQALSRRGRKPFGQCMSCRFFRDKDPSGSPHFCALLEEPLSREDSVQICAEHVEAA